MLTFVLSIITTIIGAFLGEIGDNAVSVGIGAIIGFSLPYALLLESIHKELKQINQSRN